MEKDLFLKKLEKKIILYLLRKNNKYKHINSNIIIKINKIINFSNFSKIQKILKFVIIVITIILKI